MNRNLMALTAALLLGACNTLEDLGIRSRGATPHEDYVEALRAAGLADAAVGRDWIAASEQAVRSALPAEAPLEELGYIDPAAPAAVALRVRLERGQRVAIEAQLQPASGAQLFVDVFRVPEDSTTPPRHVAAADSGTSALEYEPARTADYIVRVQPELLRGGRYRISVRSAPTLSFPVHGAGERAIGSRFGAPRDGGARDHHGIDIFAPRGTPVLAAVAGTVNRVNKTTLGGRVVWLRDERRGQSLYYAHLDEQRVTNGQRVQPGDTLGTVGNTGNARSTPPHLHFGIYRRGEGPVDPFPFVHTPPREPPPLRADTTLLGELARASRSVSLRGGARRDLSPGTVLEIVGARGTEYRAALPDGSAGWIAAAAVQPAADAARTLRLRGGCALRDRPRPDAAVITELPRSADAGLIGEFGRYALVRTRTVTGWTDCHSARGTAAT